MNNAKVFQERNIVATCDYINKYCELYVINASTMASENVRSFHNYLPTLLVHIFGSPTTRGWIQTETLLIQDTAIAQLLSPDGHFFQALLKLSSLPEYSYDLVTESLPADVKKVLSSGAIHLLPRVYSNCSYLVTTPNSNSVDIRAAATRQSTLIPATIGGDRKIRFNMLQFYLYYFVSVATWPPLPEPVQYTTATTTAFNRTTPQYGTMNRLPTATTTPNATTNSMINTTSNNNNSTSTPNAIPGKVRSITLSAYDKVMKEYLTQFIPIKSSTGYPRIIGSFFFDACAELWIRATWINTNSKLSSELMHYISSLIKYIVHHDLKQCLAGETSLIKDIYKILKDEIYTLISRLALNWSKHDSYIQVIELWCVWAAPWKLGAEIRSAEKMDYRPIQSGWCTFILDNLPYYFTIVDIFLERMSTFLYKDNTPTTTSTTTTIPAPTVVTYGDGGTISGQLRILYRLINVMKANGLVEYLGLIENSFLKVHPATNKTEYIFKQLAQQSYGSETMDKTVQEKIIDARELIGKLEGTEGVWKPKGLYSNDFSTRASSLLKTLGALNSSALARESSPTQPAEKAAKYAAQLREAYQILLVTFKVVGNAHLNHKSFDQKDAKTPAQFTPSTTTKSQWVTRSFIGGNVPLTAEEVQSVYDGKAMCSHENIPAIGQRAVSFVRSYEIPFLVSWVLRMDGPLNDYYNRYFPKSKRPKFMWETLTLRPLASQGSFLMVIAAILLILYFVIKLIF